MKNVLLDDILKEQRSLSLEIAWLWFGDMLDALGEIHQAGETHGDLKPLHIRLVDRGHVDPIGAAPVPEAGFVTGATLYMAPELLSQGRRGPESDIYALGVVFYEVLSGRKPHDFARADESLFEFASRVTGDEPAALGTWIDVPSDVEAMIMKMLLRDPRRRYRKVKQVRRDYDRIEAG